MATLTGNSIASTYTGLLSVSGAVGADTVEAVTDGAGTSTSLSLSQQRATITLGSGAGDDFIVDGTTLVVEGDTNRVGIGTTSPAYLLHLQASTDTDLNIISGTSSGDFGSILFGDTDYPAEGRITYQNFDNAMRFWTSRTQAMMINSSGNVGIGTASPSYQLELSTNSAAKPTSTLWTVPSDERLKDDIVLADLDKCYDIIQNLPLKRFKWKEDVYTNDQTDDRSVLGWIAQDVQSVFPKSVKENNFRGVSNNDAIQSIEAQDAVEWLDKPSEDNTKDEIKAWMDSNSLAYNSGDTKTDLIAKIPELKQEAIESVVGVDETYKLEIEDCLSIDADQIFRAMFGAIQKLQAKVEALESK